MENKKLIRILKTQKTKLLNSKCKNIIEFEEIQEKLNKIDIELIEAGENLILLDGSDDK